MPDVIGSIIGRAAAAACLILALAPPAAAQRPLATAPDAPQFLPRYDFHLSAALLADNGDDSRFSWDTHWGGGIDLIDYVIGRMSFYADYQAMLGNEFRPFDPNQGNYTLGAAGSFRAGATEVVGVLHHVSRHLSDRPKRESIAMNALLARVLRQFQTEALTVDLRAETGPVIARAFLDYTWLTSIDVIARRSITPLVGVYGRASGEAWAVDEAIAQRSGQQGGRVEAGLRMQGRAGVVELFGGFEKVVDAYQLDREARRWAFLGFRVVNR